jgi:hypothetical protein
MIFAIVFLIGVLVGVALAYHFAGVAALREKVQQYERDVPPSDSDRQG